MNIEWEEKEHGYWSLKVEEVEVMFLTNQQKSDLEKIFEKIDINNGD